HRQSHLYRRTEPYTHTAFVASLPVPVVPTLALFVWWRDGNLAAIKAAVTGDARQYGLDLRRRSTGH
ncbi:MAG: hypothetical protein ACRD1T_27820, partial [Acidimicrobiia bacterium]